MNSIESKVLEAFISSNRSYYFVRQHFGSAWSNARIDALAEIYDSKLLFSMHAKDRYENEILLHQYQSKNLTINYGNTNQTNS